MRHRAAVRSVGQFLLVLLLVCYTDTSFTGDSKYNQDDAQRSNLRRVVSEMIGVNERKVLSAANGGPSPTGRGACSTSRLSHICRLYERYRGGDVVYDADTIRSVNSKLGNCSSEDKRH